MCMETLTTAVDSSPDCHTGLLPSPKPYTRTHIRRGALAATATPQATPFRPAATFTAAGERMDSQGGPACHKQTAWEACVHVLCGQVLLPGHGHQSPAALTKKARHGTNMSAL